jgi:uncharacterized membrane protein
MNTATISPKEASLKAENSLTTFLEYTLIVIYGWECFALSVQNPSIWFDDAYSLATIRHSWEEIIALTTNDFHPPLYYFLLKFFSVLGGEKVVFMKLVSSFPILLTLLLTRSFLKREFKGISALIFVLCFMASQTVLFYSVEIRMYSWALFFVTMSYCSAYYAIKKDTNLWYILFTLCMLATFYTQYYAGITVGIGYIFMVMYTLRNNRSRIKTVGLIFVVATILYLPWLAVVVTQLSEASSGFWIPAFTFLDLVRYVATFFFTGNYTTSIALLVLFLVVFLNVFFKRNKTFNEHFLLVGLYCIVGLVLFGVVLSIVVRPLLISRYLVPACGLVWVFFAGGILSFRSNRTFLVIAIALLIVSATLNYVIAPRQVGGDYSSFRRYLTERIGERDIVVIAPPERAGHLAAVVAYLFPGRTMAITESDAPRGENFALDYSKGPFKMDIITYNGLKNEKSKKWLLLPNGTTFDEVDGLISVEGMKYCRDFVWSSYQSGYEFKLYVSED